MKTLPELIAYFEKSKAYFEAEIDRYAKLNGERFPETIIKSTMLEMEDNRQIMRDTVAYLQTLQKFQGEKP